MCDLSFSLIKVENKTNLDSTGQTDIYIHTTKEFFYSHFNKNTEGNILNQQIIQKFK